MKATKNLVVLASITIVLFSCKKETQSIAPAASTSTSNNSGEAMKKYFNQYRSQSQQLTMDAASGGFAYGSQGTTISFPPNALVTQSGAAVTGQVNIALKEVFTKGDMILNNLAPMSNGSPLVSGGEFSLTVSQGGNQLKLAAGKTVYVQVPSTVPDYSMQFFRGKDMADGSVNWNLKTNAINIAKVRSIVHWAGQISTGFIIY